MSGYLKGEYLEKTEDFLLGIKEGIELYAWWKDGAEYVGCGVWTKKQAWKEIDDIIEKVRQKREEERQKAAQEAPLNPELQKQMSQTPIFPYVNAVEEFLKAMDAAIIGNDWVSAQEKDITSAAKKLYSYLAPR